MTFTPEGKLRYLTAGFVVSKVEGNTRGFGAVLALFVNAGLPQLAQIALDTNIRAVGTWIANNVDSSVAKNPRRTSPHGTGPSSRRLNSRLCISTYIVAGDSQFIAGSLLAASLWCEMMREVRLGTVSRSRN